VQVQAFHTLDFAQRGTAGWLEALDRACRASGCFQLRNHSLDATLCASVLSEMEHFFALSHAEKLSVERTAENPWGFYDRELTKNVRDWKEIFDIGPASRGGPFSGASTPWPALTNFRGIMEAYYAACESLALALLADIGECLGVRPGTLEREFGEGHSSFLRLNYYPPCTNPDHHLGISHHTDAGALTLLLPDTQPGLQFQLGNDWHTVAAQPGALIVNIGDIVQVWSNDAYRAPLHRVLANASHSRFSSPFFLNPRYDTVYAPLPGALKGGAPRYRPITWGEFRAGRAAGDYADVGAEIQISDFRCQILGSAR
jgi:isopenicillin N synthase-like dioxygenase